MNPIQETEPFILVEGPRWADAEFYGKWLLMATKAQALWEKALKCPSFEKQTALLTVLYIPTFDYSASVFLFQLKKNLVSFTIPLRNSEDWAELDQFTLMAEMGFFVLTDGRYQMAKGARDRVRRAQGKCEGRKTYAEREGGRELVALARQLHGKPNGQPQSLRKIAGDLAERGCVTPSGRPYSASAIASMLGER